MAALDRRTLALLAALVAAPPCVRAQGEYRVQNFTTSDGLSQNTISGIGQTRDGYLWFSTFDGLVRYDGVSFTAFDRGNSPMRQTLFENLRVDGAGTLWAGTGAGIVRYKDGVLEWLQAPNTPFGHAHPADPHTYSGWVAPPPPRWRLDGNYLVESSGQRFLIPGVDELRRGIFNMVSGEDRDGYVWLFGRNTIIRFRGGRFERFSSDSLLGTREPRSGLIDREGALWIGTNDRGAFRLSRRFLSTIAVKEGLIERGIYPVMEDRSGRVWVSSGATFSRIERGHVTSFRVSTEGGHFSIAPVQRGAAPTLGVGTAVRSFFEDKRGRVWLGLVHGVIALVGDAVVAAPHVRRFLADTAADLTIDAIAEDATGDFWFGTHVGLIRMHGDSLTRLGSDDGLPSEFITALHVDRGGKLWIGTRNGIARYDGGHFTSWTRAQGLPGEIVRTIYSDSDGTLWIGFYDSGLARLRNGDIASFTTTSGLFANGVFCILEDARGNFWMSSNRGIFRVSRQQLNDFADGKARTIGSVAYGTRDGMRTSEANGGRQPPGWRARDGKLWFPTGDGAVIIDPSLIEYNAKPPVVVFEQATVDGLPVAARNAVHLKPGETELDITYTAPSSVQAEHIQFKYRLVGLGDDWIEAGTQRRVHYSHLDPGSYSLEVAAANTDGVWNKVPTVLDVEVAPHFWQTTWFFITGLVAILGLTTTGYKLRVANLKETRRQLTIQVNERTAELREANTRLEEMATHDGLTGLANRRRFDAFMGEEWQRSWRSGSPLSVLMLDVDHFKAFNDSLGHQAGDECLKHVAAAIAGVVRRGTDLAARFGGEEFAVVLSGATTDRARFVGEQIREAVTAAAIPHPKSPVGAHVTISIGVATTKPDQSNGPADVIKAADAALYRAKAAGRNRVTAAESRESRVES